MVITKIFLGLMQPVKINRDGLEEVLVDGGLILNYPLQCYDGEYAC
jgi:predicted acylesterase/phospholipase RssA